MKYYGGIEAGGTKMICAVMNEDGVLAERFECPTTTPEETMPKLIHFFNSYTIESLGIGCFGPIDVHKSSSTYGHILQTPKKAWRNFDFLGSFQKAFSVETVFTTDVNAAAYGEMISGTATNNRNFLYITIGTGIGVGVIINREIYHGFTHPEAGHLLIRKHADDHFSGSCPNHHDCLEGLASGPAIEARFKKKAFDLYEDDPFWTIEAYYLAQAVYNYALTVSPECVIFGGGVSKQRQLLPLIQKELEQLNMGYIALPDHKSFLRH